LTNIQRLAEPTFRRIAAELRVDLLSSARWPELRLKRRTGWTVTELRLSLDPGHARQPTSMSKWVINLVRYPRFPWLPFGASEVESIDLLDENDLSTEGRFKDCMKDAVRRAFAPLQ
jgi:hypothetical protein